MGTSLLVAVKDRDGPQLYLVDPSGTALVPLPLRFTAAATRASMLHPTCVPMVP